MFFKSVMNVTEVCDEPPKGFIGGTRMLKVNTSQMRLTAPSAPKFWTIPESGVSVPFDRPATNSGCAPYSNGLWGPPFVQGDLGGENQFQGLAAFGRFRLLKWMETLLKAAEGQSRRRDSTRNWACTGSSRGYQPPPSQGDVTREDPSSPQ